MITQHLQSTGMSTCLQVFVLFVVLSTVKTQSCVTPNGENAQCVSIHNCNIFLQALGTADDKGKQFLRESVCRHDNGVPIVCCGTATTYKNLGATNGQNLLPDRSVCGLQDFTDKVFGGEDAGLLEFPWMVVIQYLNNYGQLGYKCGGALINERYVLTAAHCVKNAKLKIHRVRLGEWNLDEENDCIGSGKYKRCIPKPIDLEVDEAIAHQSYDRSNQGVFYDIALLRLKTKVHYSDSIRPICLPDRSEKTSTGRFLEVAGWGNTEYASHSAVKQKVALPIMDPTQCKGLFANKGVTIDDKQICAGGEEGKDSCKGDSGGPLMARVQGSSDQYYIEGIVSYGVRCGTPGYPGIYTRVSDYLDWIKAKIRP